jgi:hypothetical protein
LKTLVDVLRFLVFFVFALLIQFLILQVYSDFVEKAHFDIIGVINVVYVGDIGDVSIGGTGVMFNGVVGGSPIFQVYDSSIVVAFGGPLFDILPSVPSFSCSVIVGFTN